MECFVALLALGVLAAFIFSLIAWQRARAAESLLQRTVPELERRVEALVERRLRDLAGRGAERATPPAEARPEAPPPAAAAHAAHAAAPPAFKVTAPAPAAPAPAPAAAGVPVTSPTAEIEVPVTSPAAVPLAEVPVTSPTASPTPPAAQVPVTSPVAAPAPAPPPPPQVLVTSPAGVPATSPAPPFRPAPPRPPAPPVAPSGGGFDWEGLVGVKLFSWIAGVALVLAAIFFLRWSIEYGLLGPGVRLALGVAAGLGLLGVCELKVARRYPVTANAMDAAAVAILFSSFYAGHALWRLYPAAVAFLALALVAAVAVVLSLRRDSLFIALLGLLGGFATPALLSSGVDRPYTLFGYLLLLNAGLVWVGRKRGWPLLPLLSLGFTFLYQWGWVSRFLTGDKLPLAMGIFVVFPLLYLLLSSLPGEAEETGERSITSIALLLPLLLPLYLSVHSGFAAQYGLFFGFLFLLAAGLAAVATFRGPESLHTAAAVAVGVTFLSWLVRSYSAEAWPGILGFLALFVVFYLAVPLALRRLERPFVGLGAHAVFVAPFLFFAFPYLAWDEPLTVAPGLLFGVLFALLAAVGGFALAAESGWVFLPAAGFAVLAEVVWSARHLDADGREAALVLYTAFGLLALAVPALAASWRRRLPPGIGVYLAPVSYLLLLFVAAQSSLAVPPAPLFAALLVLLLAHAAAALGLGRGGLEIASVAGAALVLLIWAAAADRAPWPQVGVWAALALAAFAGSAFALARRRAGTMPAQPAKGFAAAAVVAAFAGQVLLILVSVPLTSPGLLLLLGGQALLLLLLFGLAEATGWGALAPVSVLFSAWAAVVWSLGEDRPGGWVAKTAFPVALFLLYAAYPLVLGERARARRAPFLAAILAAAALFLPALSSFKEGSWADWVGFLPLGFALVLALVLWRLLQLRPVPGSGEAVDNGRIAQVAGTILAFVTVAIPLQLDREWITIGWALLVAALAWLWRRVPHAGLLAWTGGLAVAVFLRLVANPAVLTYHPRSGVPIWNWYLYTYLVPAAAFLAAAWLLRGAGEERLGALGKGLAAALAIAGTVLLFLLLNIEIADFYSTGTALTFGFLTGRATLAEDLTYTLGWAVFAMALLVTGIAARSRPTRLAAILLLAVAVLKGFLHDMGRLGGLYRAASFLGLAICLAAVAVLIQRFVLKREEAE